MLAKRLLPTARGSQNLATYNLLRTTWLIAWARKLYSHERSSNFGKKKAQNGTKQIRKGDINSIEHPKDDKPSNFPKRDGGSKGILANLVSKNGNKQMTRELPNLVLALLQEKFSLQSEKETLIDQYRQIVCERFEGGSQNSADKNDALNFSDIFATLYLCYVEKIFDLDFVTKVNSALEVLLSGVGGKGDQMDQRGNRGYRGDRVEGEKDGLNEATINYCMMMFHYLSSLNVKNVTLCNQVRNYIVNNEVPPLVIYHYLECLSLLADSTDRSGKHSLRDYVLPVVEIFLENFYNFNNYLLLRILHFLHKLNFMDAELFLLLTRKINKNVYLENANRFELCLLARTYALYKKENITFNNYLCEDLMRSLTKYEDNFQGDEGGPVSSQVGSKVSGEVGSQVGTTPEESSPLPQESELAIPPDVLQIENVNRQNYTLFRHPLYNDGLNFYAFFVEAKTSNREKCFERKNNLNVTFVSGNANEMDRQGTSAHMSEWHKLFLYNEYKEKDIRNEPFVKLDKTKKGDRKMVEAYNQSLAENLHFQFSHKKIAQLFEQVSERMDNVKVNFTVDAEGPTQMDEEAIHQYRKKILYVENYYIGHIFHLVDSLLSLKAHHNCATFKKMENKILNAIKNNELYIIDNFDSEEIKSLLIFLSHTNRNYKEAFIYGLTHRMVDLYINNLCHPSTLSTFFHFLLNFTKHRVVKKNRFNHTIRNVIYNSYSWLNDNKSFLNMTAGIDAKNWEEKENSNTRRAIKAKNYSLLQVLTIHVCKNVYFMSLSTLASLLRSMSYLSFPDPNFFNVFIPLFMKHMADLSNVDILNITQAYNKQKIQNKYFYYLLAKQYQGNRSEETKNVDQKIKLVG
ncbi:hypothetical protein C922_03134 [Plasmodium inui San Antonio 1]|uniref:Uncharacterized protein n=1 Tax=Plasmodium inui San Antonio 1 TaxID=1237626 RepID=W7A4A4_9APIC|nr:hypothetical protein C922_03134 [Plasmodium inui San Antonio 1]EUD66500.1 hypothetical protein C922_03134 [Plasmodium inui San Antonio 1]